MSYVQGLRCKECGTLYPLELRTLCPEDFAPLEVAYDYEAMRGRVNRDSIEKGPTSLWRYRDLLPIEGEPRAGLDSGWTPLRRADRLAAELDVRELYIKDDSANYPTFSYKDRVVSVAVTKALEFGLRTVGCASTGNLAHSVAAHAAAAGLEAVVLIPHDLEQGKILGTQMFGPKLINQYCLSGMTPASECSRSPATMKSDPDHPSSVGHLRRRTPVILRAKEVKTPAYRGSWRQCPAR